MSNALRENCTDFLEKKNHYLILCRKWVKLSSELDSRFQKIEDGWLVGFVFNGTRSKKGHTAPDIKQ